MRIERIKYIFIIIVSIVLLIMLLPIQNIISSISYGIHNKNEYIINLRLLNPSVKMLSADGSNELVMKVEVHDKKGKPIPQAHISFNEALNIGSISPKSVRTNKSGEAIAVYTPPEFTTDSFKRENTNIVLKASFYNTKIFSSVSIKLTRPPVVFVHGYRSKSYLFDTMKGYLSIRGFSCTAINYDSIKGVISSSKEFSNFLQNETLQYLKKGIQVKKFDVISHSMGGLVTRYYSCSTDYIKFNNIRKMIFISVPHKGSPWAVLGANYYDDAAIIDLKPDSPIIANIFPTLLNKGLNNTIQTGNILGQYDEVVSEDSGNLSEWGIDTLMFNVGGNHMTIDNLLNGIIMESANHKNILNNKKVFEKIQAMLCYKLPFPAVR